MPRDQDGYSVSFAFGVLIQRRCGDWAADLHSIGAQRLWKGRERV